MLQVVIMMMIKWKLVIKNVNSNYHNDFLFFWTVHMRAESKNIDSRVRLQSVHSNDFVCFNDKGRLVVKVSI